MEVTAVFQGITTPVSDLYNEIHMRGWQVSKVDVKDGQYVAEASNPHGEKIEKVGRDPNTALAALLMFIMRREYIRQGAWSTHWADQLEPIARSYAKAPHFDPKAAAAWKELADDCVARAAVLSHQLAIEITHDPEPYDSPQELWEDVQKNRHLLVSDAATEHPVWTRDQVIAFRICHDVLGHAAAGGDFGWTGENLATAAHMPYLSPNAQQALFAETVGQAAYNNYYRGLGPQKIALLNDHLEPVQQAENPPGHGGEHPQMSLVPGQMPTRSGGVLRDPNYGYETNIIPPPQNAVTAYGDPLQYRAINDGAHALNTGWANFEDEEGKPDHERMKVAVMNALRAALLSPLKELKWNATHYQDLSHIPYHVSDPKVYWDALENARVNHNRAQGFPDPEIRHKPHYEALLEFYRYYARHNPQLNPSEAKSAADREVMVMQAEIEEAMLHNSKDNDYELIAPKVSKKLDKRLKQIVKDDKPLHTAAVENPYDPNRQAYGAFMGRSLVTIAQVSRYADLLTEAALEDVKRHDGSGHVFRSMALRLGIPGLGPKIVSFAWLLLQPLTSQLATVDTHIADALGYKYKDVANNRDYFRLERELQAGRDAAGYSHVPLGQFQWGLWDYKRTGMGTHQDHTPLRPWEPTPHHQVEWKPKIPSGNAKGSEWEPPEWWAITQPYREAEAAAWSHDVAVQYPQNQYPWQEADASVPHIAADGSADETHLAIDVPEWVRKNISEYVGTLNIAPERLIDPGDYHITVAYAPHDVDEVTVHAVLNNFNLTGLKFEVKSLKKLGDAGALVIELENPDFDEYATRINDFLEEEYGIEVSRYDNGYTPHITVAYMDDEAPDDQPPKFSFRGGGLSFSTPRNAAPMPSLWAKYISQRLAAQHWECTNCHHDFGEHKPDFSTFQYCPGCGRYLSDHRIQLRKDPNQMEIDWHAGQPPQIKWMDLDDRPRYEEHYSNRLTTAYDSQNNILYIGPTGTWHMDMGDHFSIPVREGEYGNALTDNANHFYVGYINLAHSPDRDEYPDLRGAKMGWYHRTPENAETIEQAVVKPAGEAGQAKSEEEEWADLGSDFDFDLDDAPGSQMTLTPGFEPFAEEQVVEHKDHPGKKFEIVDVLDMDYSGNKGKPKEWRLRPLDGGLDIWAREQDIIAQPQQQHSPIALNPIDHGFKTLGDAPIGTKFDVTTIYDKSFEITDNTGEEIQVSQDGNAGVSAWHPASSPWPSGWIVTYLPKTNEQGKPATFADVPHGSHWAAPSGAVYKAVHQPDGIYTHLVQDSYGNVYDEGELTPVKNLPEYTFPPDWEFTNKPVTKDEQSLNELSELGEPKPKQTPWKINDIAMLSEEKLEQYQPNAAIDTTVYKIIGFNQGKVELLSPHDQSITEVPEDWLEKPNSMDQVVGEEQHGITDEYGKPPSLSGEHSALFVTTQDGQKYRASDWTDWEQAQDQWLAHDNKRINGGNQSSLDIGTQSYPISHFGVRSGDDLAYNILPKIHPGQIYHPPGTGTFSHVAQRLKRCTRCHGPLDVKGICTKCGKHHYGAGELPEYSFYHVAPAAARESIRLHGLNPELRDKSPWSDLNKSRPGFPAGTFLFEHPELARSYVNVLYDKWKEGERGKRGESTWSGSWQPSLEDFIDYNMSVDGSGKPYVSQWPEEEDDGSDPNYGPEERPYDHETDRQELLPAHMQGWDIWHVKLPGTHVRPDPEPWHGKGEPYNPQDLVAPDMYGTPSWEGAEMTEPRWYTPTGIQPHQVQLADHVPLISMVSGDENVTGSDAYHNPHHWENVNQEAYDYHVPEQWTHTDWPDYHYYHTWRQNQPSMGYTSRIAVAS